MRKLGLFALLTVALAACSVELPHDAPYDPETPAGKQARARVTGVVTLQGEADFSQVAVHLESDTAAYEATTLKDGSFTITGIVPGSYRVVYDTRYFEAQRGELTLSPGQSLVLSPVGLKLRTASVTGSALAKLVKGASYVTEGGVSVIAERTGSVRSAAAAPWFRPAADEAAAAPETTTTLSAADGGFSLVLAAGRYRLTFARSDVASEDGGEVVVTGEQAVLTLEPVTLLPLTGFVKIAGTANGAPSYTLTNTAAVTLEISGFNAAEMKLGRSFDGTAAGCGGYVRQTYKAAVAAVLPAEGTNTVCAVFVGRDGAESDPALASIVYDQSSPVLPFVRINGGAGYLNTNLLTLELSAVDATAGVDRMRVTTGALGAATAEPFVPAKVFALPAVGSVPVEGRYTLWAQFLDRAGNASVPVSATVQIDRTAPAASAVARNAAGAGLAASNSAEFYVHLAVTDASPVSVQYSAVADFTGVSPEAYQPLRRWTAAPPTNPDGEWRAVHTRVVDAAGNVSLPAPVAVFVDTAAPTAPSLALAASLVSSPTVSVNLFAQGALTVELAADIGFMGPVRFSYRPATTYTFPAGDGLKTLYARFVDATGNATGILAASATLDQTPPQLPSLRIREGALTNVSLVHLDLAAVDAAEMQIAQGSCGGTWVAYAATATLGLTPGDGPKVVYARFRDAAGNATACLAQTVVYDGTRPVLGTPAVRINAGGTYARERSVTLALDAGGADEMRFSESAGFAGSPWQPMAATANFTLSNGDAAKTVWAQFRDAAGNTTEATASVILDTTGPEQPLVVVAGGNGYAQTTVVGLTLSATGSPLYYRATTDGILDNKVWQAYVTSASISLGAGSDGPRTVAAQFQDAAGNNSPVASAQVFLDRAAPAAAVVRVDDGAVYTSNPQGNVSLNLSAVDAGSGLATVRVGGSAAALATAPTLPFEPTKLFTLAVPGSDGLKEVWVTYGDKAGNYAAPVSGLITLDRTPPTAALSSPLGSLAASNILPVHIDAPADTAAMLLSNDAGFYGAVWQPFQSDVIWTFPAVQGNVRLYAKFRDQAGNTTPGSFSVAVTLDTVAPAVAAVSAVVRSDTLTWDHFGAGVTGYSVLLYQGGTVLSVTRTTEKRLAVGSVAPGYIVVAHYADGTNSLPSYPPGYFVPATVTSFIGASLRAPENALLRGMPGVAALGSISEAPCSGQVNLVANDMYTWPQIDCGLANAVFFGSADANWSMSAPRFMPGAPTTAANPWAALPFAISGASVWWPMHSYDRTYLQVPATLHWPMSYNDAVWAGQPVLVGGAFKPETLSGQNFFEMTVPFAAAAVTDDVEVAAWPYSGSTAGYAGNVAGRYQLRETGLFAGIPVTSVTVLNGNMVTLNDLWNGDWGNGYASNFPGTLQLPWFSTSTFDGDMRLGFANANYYCTYAWSTTYNYWTYSCNWYGTNIEFDAAQSKIVFTNTSPYDYNWEMFMATNRTGTRTYRIPIPSNAQGYLRWTTETAQPAFAPALEQMIRRAAAPVRVRGTGRAVLTSDVPQADAMQVSTDANFAGAAWQAYQPSLTLADGEAVVYVRYRDAAGNVTPAEPVTVVAPTTAPRIDQVVISGPNAAPGYSTSANVTARVYGTFPAGSRVRYAATPVFSDGGWQTAVNGSIPVALPPQAGRYWYYFWVADPSDNFSLPVSASVLFDGTPPQAEFSMIGGEQNVRVQGRYTVKLSPYQPSITDTVSLGAPLDYRVLPLEFEFPYHGQTFTSVDLDPEQNCLRIGGFAGAQGDDGLCAVARDGFPVEASYKSSPTSFLVVWMSTDAAGVPVTSAVELNASGLMRLVYWRTNAHVKLTSSIDGVQSPYTEWRYALAQGAVEYQPNPSGIHFVLRSAGGSVIEFTPQPCMDRWFCGSPWYYFPVTDTGWTRWTGTAYSGGGAAGTVTAREVRVTDRTTTPLVSSPAAAPLSDGRYWVTYDHPGSQDTTVRVDGKGHQDSAVIAGRDQIGIQISIRGSSQSLTLPYALTARAQGHAVSSGAPLTADRDSTLLFGADGAMYDAANPDAPAALRAVGGAWPFGNGGNATRFGNQLWAANGVWDLTNLDAPSLLAGYAARASAVYRGRVYAVVGSELRIYDAANVTGAPINTIWGDSFIGPIVPLGDALYIRSANGSSAWWYRLDLLPDPDAPSLSFFSWGGGLSVDAGRVSNSSDPIAGLGLLRIQGLANGFSLFHDVAAGAAYGDPALALTARGAEFYRSFTGGFQIHSLGDSLPRPVAQVPWGAVNGLYADQHFVYVCGSGGLAWYTHDLVPAGSSNLVGCNSTSLRIAYPWVYSDSNRLLIEGASLTSHPLEGVPEEGAAGGQSPLTYVGAGYTDWNGRWYPTPESTLGFEFGSPAANAHPPTYRVRAERDVVYVQFPWIAGKPVSGTTTTSFQYSGIVSGAVRPPLVPLVSDGTEVADARDGFLVTGGAVYFVESLTAARQVRAGALQLLPGHFAYDSNQSTLYSLQPTAVRPVARWAEASVTPALAPGGRAYGFDANARKLLVTTWGPGTPELRFRETEAADSPQLAESGGYVYVAAGGAGLWRLAPPTQIGTQVADGLVTHDEGGLTLRTTSLEKVNDYVPVTGETVGDLCGNWRHRQATVVGSSFEAQSVCTSASALPVGRLLQGDQGRTWYGMEAPVTYTADGAANAVAVDEGGLVYAGFATPTGGSVAVFSPAQAGLAPIDGITGLMPVSQVATSGGFVAVKHGTNLGVWRVGPTALTPVWDEYNDTVRRVRMQAGRLAYTDGGVIYLRDPASGATSSCWILGGVVDFDLYLMRWAGREHPVAVAAQGTTLRFVSLDDCSALGYWVPHTLTNVESVRVQGSRLLLGHGMNGGRILSLADFPRMGIATLLEGGRVNDALIQGRYVYTGGVNASPQVFELH